MAKQKKKLSDIKDALLANASYIKNDEQTVAESITLPENSVEIDKSVFAKMKILAGYYQKDTVELISEALSHYLRLKKLDIDEALKNIVVGDDEE